MNRCISKRQMYFVNLKSFFKQVRESKIILDLRIVFLKPCNLTFSVNLSAEAVQLPITVKPTDVWRFGFQNTRVRLLEQLKESKVRYLHDWGTTCWIVTIQWPGKISLSLIESQTTTYWKQRETFSLNVTTPP